MTLDEIRERMAEFLKQAGLDAVSAWPEAARTRRSAPVIAVSLRQFQGGPGGFQDYLGERYNQESGRWEELYGKKARITFGLDLYAPTGDAAGAAGIQKAFDAMSQALHQNGPEGMRIVELSCAETKFDQESGLFRRSAEAVCEIYLYAIADEGGAFLDFEVRGNGKI